MAYPVQRPANYINPGEYHSRHMGGGIWVGTSDSDLIYAPYSIWGANGNDTLIGQAQAGSGEIHARGMKGQDIIVMDFAPRISNFSSGHHVFGEHTAENDRSPNTFRFANTSNVVTGGVVVGRIQDFDASRDTLIVDGVTIDLLSGRLPSNIRVVEYGGDPNDSLNATQQWLLIETKGGGTIFYALEGYRIDMKAAGGSGGSDKFAGHQEFHFIPAPPNFSKLKAVEFVDPVNYVPAGFKPDGGAILNDDDINIQNVRDIFTGTSAGDLMAAGANNDVVKAFGGNDRVWGGTGDDLIYAADGLDTVLGGFGNDTLVGGRGDDQLYGELGNDTLRGQGGVDILRGGSGRDYLHGGAMSDRLFGGAGADTLRGAAGNDRIQGNSGNDRLFGQSGNDHLHGGWGQDYLKGGAGRDTLLGYHGNDVLRGGSSGDSLQGNNGNDRLFGQAGQDYLDGGQGNDLLQGGTSADTLIGNIGDDTLRGGEDDDNIWGSDGHDRLAGQSGNDQLHGGSGRDSLEGGTGLDTLIGGADADYFVFRRGGGKDVIVDFKDNVDTVIVSGFDIPARMPLSSLATYRNGDVILDFGDGGILIVRDTTLAALEDDIAFV